MQMRGEKDVYVPKLKGRKFIKVLLRLLEVCNTHFWQGESRFFWTKILLGTENYVFNAFFLLDQLF